MVFFLKKKETVVSRKQNFDFKTDTPKLIAKFDYINHALNSSKK